MQYKRDCLMSGDCSHQFTSHYPTFQIIVKRVVALYMIWINRIWSISIRCAEVIGIAVYVDYRIDFLLELYVYSRAYCNEHNRTAIKECILSLAAKCDYTYFPSLFYYFPVKLYLTLHTQYRALLFASQRYITFYRIHTCTYIVERHETCMRVSVSVAFCYGFSSIRHMKPHTNIAIWTYNVYTYTEKEWNQTNEIAMCCAI